MNGEYRTAELCDDAKCHRGATVNDVGFLECRLVGGPRRPSGSWTKSCTDVSFNCGILATTCEEKNRNKFTAWLRDGNRCRLGAIWNDDGKLSVAPSKSSTRRR